MKLRNVLFILLSAASPAHSAEYELVWTPAPNPIPIDSSLLWALVPLVFLIAAKHWRAASYYCACLLVFGAVLISSVGALLDAQANGTRNITITTKEGQTVASCSGQTVIVETESAILFQRVSPDFQPDTVTTLACGTECSAGATLQARNSCTLRCPSSDPVDSDGDGTTDADDAFPCDQLESVDTDGDGVGNNADDDDDGDGVNDIDDPTPQGENNPPTFDNPPPLISVPENQIFVHQFSAVDSDGDQLAFSIAGSDADKFNISSQGLLTLRQSQDYEGALKLTLSVSIRVTDGASEANWPSMIKIVDVEENIFSNCVFGRCRFEK